MTPPTAIEFRERVVALIGELAPTQLRESVFDQDEHGITARLRHATEDHEIVAYVGDHEGMVFAGDAHEHFEGPGWVDRAAAFVGAALCGEVVAVKRRRLPPRAARHIDFR